MNVSVLWMCLLIIGYGSAVGIQDRNNHKKVMAAVVDNGCTGANQLQITAKPQTNQTTYDIN